MDEYPSEKALNHFREAVENLRTRIARGERDYIIINPEDCRPIDEDDIWAGQMFLAREKEDEDNE